LKGPAAGPAQACVAGHKAFTEGGSVFQDNFKPAVVLLPSCVILYAPNQCIRVNATREITHHVVAKRRKHRTNSGFREFGCLESNLVLVQNLYGSSPLHAAPRWAWLAAYRFSTA
jgi:hypothetical protein